MPWATAKVKGVVIAETDFPQVVGGDVYFPADCVKWEYLSDANHQKKGSHRQFNLSVNGTTVFDAAWCHSDPPRKLESVKDHVAFVGMAPVMIMYKKNFRYARSGDSHLDAGSVHTMNSTPNTSMPTTPTLGYSYLYVEKGHIAALPQVGKEWDCPLYQKQTGISRWKLVKIDINRGIV